MSSSFYVQLPSNTNISENRTCNFRVRLAKKLQFNSEWAVGLAVISYPHSWPSIGTNEPQYIQIHWKICKSMQNNEFHANFIEKLLPSVTKIDVPKSKHFNAERLEDALSTLIQNSGKKLATDLENRIKEVKTIRIRTSLDPQDISNVSFDEMIQFAQKRVTYLKQLEHHLIFVYHREYQRFQVHYSCLTKTLDDNDRIEDNNCITSVEVSQQLGYVIGLESTKLPTSGNYVSYAPDMLGGISSLYVYAPALIEPVIVGDTTAPILRIVHVKGKPDDNIEDIYAAVQYHKLLIKEVSEIKIEIRTSSGRLVPFEYGNCLLTLHFRKLPYF